MALEHDWVWREMIGAIDHMNLSDAQMLDVDCNQGGFLRPLYDLKRFS